MSNDDTFYECNSVIKYEDIVEINGPYETKIVHNNPKRDITYFDTKSMLLILSNMNNDYTKDSQDDIYTFYGKIDDNKFRITLNTKSCLIEVINITINICTNFEAYEISTTEYPIYQYSRNPVIVLLAVFVAACYACKTICDDLLLSAEKINSKFSNDEDYYLDEFSILMLSIYKQTLLLSTERMQFVVENKLRNLNYKLADLEIVDMKSNNEYNGNVMYCNTKTEIKEISKKTYIYSELDGLLKTLKKTDNLMELSVGNKSYFMIIRNEKIMTISKSEFNTTYTKSLDEDLIKIYNDVSIAYVNVVINFNQHIYNIQKEDSYDPDTNYMPYSN
jgi:hypothetical protein